MVDHHERLRFRWQANTLDCGFVINPGTGKIWATSAKTGYIYNEGDATDGNNDL